MPARGGCAQGSRPCRCGLFCFHHHAVFGSPERGHPDRRIEPSANSGNRRHRRFAARGTHRASNRARCGRFGARESTARGGWREAQGARGLRRGDALWRCGRRDDAGQGKGDCEVHRLAFGEPGFRRSFPRRKRGVRLRLGRTLDPRRGLFENRSRRDQGVAGEDGRCRVRHRALHPAVPFRETRSDHRQALGPRSRENAGQSGRHRRRCGIGAFASDAGPCAGAGQTRRENSRRAIRPGLRCRDLRGDATRSRDCPSATA